MSDDTVYVATETFCVEHEGRDVVIHKDQTRIRSGHPIVLANPDRFRAVDNSVHLDFEQATAAPGEKRGAAKPKAS